MRVCERIDEAIGFCKEALSNYNSGCKIDIDYTLTRILAALLRSKGCEEESENLIKGLLDEARLTYGKESEKFEMAKWNISRSSKSFWEDLDLNSLVKEFNRRKATFGENDDYTLKAQEILAVYQMKNGHDNDAIETFEDLIIKYKMVCKAEHVSCDNAFGCYDSLKAEENVAGILFKIGRKEEALQLCQNVYENYLKFPLINSHQFPVFCISYAAILKDVSSDTEALEILENCKMKLNEVYGSHHAMMSGLQRHIGVLQCDLGKFKEALATKLEALQIAKTMFGENSFQLISCKESIAISLLCLGKLKESVSCFNELLDQIDTSGTLHLRYKFRFVRSLKNFGYNLEALKLLIRMKNSQKIAGDSVEIESLSKEINHTRLKIEMEKEIKNVCRAYLRDDISYKMARSKLWELYSVLKKRYGINSASADLLFFWSLFIARFKIEGEDFEMSLMPFKNFYNLYKNGACENQMITQHVLIAIGDSHFGLKDYKQALAIHKETYEKLSDVHGDLHVTTIEAKIRIATDLFCKGNQEESISMFEEIAETLQELEAVNPNDNGLTLNMLKYAVKTVAVLFKGDNPRSKQIFTDIEKVKEIIEPKVLNDQLYYVEEFITSGNYEKALNIYLIVYWDADSPIWKADIGQAALACKNLSHVLNQLGKHEEALEILEGNLELVKTNLGIQHHSTYLLQRSLAHAYQGLGNLEEALKLHNEAYQGLLITLDEDHEEVLILKQGIAVDLSLLGRHEESICSFLEVLDKLETTSGNESHQVILAKIEFAEAIVRSNEGLQDALKILENLNKVMTSVIDKESLLFKKVFEAMSRIKDKLGLEQQPA